MDTEYQGTIRITDPRRVKNRKCPVLRPGGEIIMLAVKIYKPIYSDEGGCVVGVRDKYINQAIRNKERIKVISYWKGQETSKDFNPKDIKLISKKIEKVFLRPEEPMVLYEVRLPRAMSQAEESIELIKKGLI